MQFRSTKPALKLVLCILNKASSCCNHQTQIHNCLWCLSAKHFNLCCSPGHKEQKWNYASKTRAVYTLHGWFPALNTSLREEIGSERSREMLPETIPKTSRGQSNNTETVQFIPDAAAGRQTSTFSHPSRGLTATLMLSAVPSVIGKIQQKQTMKHFQLPILQRCRISALPLQQL